MSRPLCSTNTSPDANPARSQRNQRLIYHSRAIIHLLTEAYNDSPEAKVRARVARIAAGFDQELRRLLNPTPTVQSPDADCVIPAK